MYNREVIDKLIKFISEKNGIADKKVLEWQVKQTFNLDKARSVFYGDWFAIRFCKASKINFSNTVLGLSVLRQYDDKPFIVCLVTPQINYLLLANTSFLKKISHSSQALRVDNIKGSFNGSDIMRDFEGTANIPENFEYLYSIHENYTFEENLKRLVEETNNIVPTGKRFCPTPAELDCIRMSVYRAISFLKSSEYVTLNVDLCYRVNAVKDEIAMLALTDNVNMRGRAIEYLITANDDLKKDLIKCLHEGKPLSKFFTADDLGDYERDFGRYLTETDIKTKLLFLSSNPKGYNIDKLLSFLSKDKSVYLIFIVAIDQNKNIITRLCTMYNKQLLERARITKHWSGRNSRGEIQYDGKSLEAIVENFDNTIDFNEAQNFLTKCLNN